jgi:hypothetical protein
MSPAPGISNKLVAVLYNTIAPAAEIDRQVFDPPHAAPQTVSFTNKPIGTYIVKVHQSTDGIVLGNLENDFFVNAAITTSSAYTVKTFQVGLGRSAPYYDPSNGDTDYINPDLDGLDYIVFKPGYGPLDWAADITTYPGGGFSFTNLQTFAQDEIYTILISNLVQTVGSGPVSQTFPAGVQTITGDVSFTSALYNMIIEVTAPNNATITLPSLATIPDGTQFAINTHSLFSDSYTASFRYAALQLAVGEVCIINNVSHNLVHVGRCESMTFVKYGSVLRITNGGDAYRDLGTIVHAATKPPKGSLPFTGAWYDIGIFARFFYNYVNLLDPAELGTGTDNVAPSADNATKWIIGTSMFYVPNYKGRFLRIADPDGVFDVARYPGSNQADAVGPANINTIVWTGNGMGNSGVPGGTPTVNALGTAGAGGSISTTGATGTNNNAAKTLPWSIISPAGESRPKNIACAAYVLI